MTNSFKIRGALNKVFSLSENQLKNGIVVTSSGNHAIAAAYAAKLRGAKTIAILRDSSPEYKRNIVRELCTEVIFSPNGEEVKKAKEYVETVGCEYIHSHDDIDIINGQGTVGLEIIKEEPSIDKIVVPMGGGGLVAGLSAVVKLVKPDIQVYGCEPSVINCFTKSIECGKPVQVEDHYSVADALLPLKPGEIAFPIIQKYLDKVLAVNEENIAKGSFLLLTTGKILAEISSAIVIGAAIQAGKYFS